MLNWWKYSVKDFNGKCDGEIQFEYGERFYHIKKIIVKKE